MVDNKSGPAERRQEILNDARMTLSESMGDLWWTFLVRGVLALILGVVALFWPTASVSLLLRLVGLFLIVDGAVVLIGSRNRTDVGSGNIFSEPLIGRGSPFSGAPGTSTPR